VGYVGDLMMITILVGVQKKIRQNQTVHDLKIVFHNGKKRDVLGKSWKIGF
jgi:predicted nuclease of restriction endonuclease-like (RecB) superfamily